MTPTTAAPPVLFVIHQLGSQSDGGIQSITELLSHSSARCRQIIVTNIDSAATRRWRCFADVRVWPMREFDLTRGSRRSRSRSAQLWCRFRNNLRVRALVREQRIRVVHCNDHIAFGHAGVGAKLAGARIVFNVRDTLRVGSRKRRLWQVFLRLCDRFLVLSHEMVEAWRVDLAPLSGRPAQAAKFCFVYSIVDRQRYSPVDDAARRRIRDRLGVVPNRPAVLSVGRVEDKKGQLQFLRHGLPLLVKSRPDVIVYFVSDFDPEHDSYASRCAAAVSAAGLAGQVRFIGYSPEIADWYRAADVVILTSKREGLPRCVIEGIASGASVVAFDVCSVREILEDHQCGVAVGREDHAGMATAIADLLADPRRAELYRERGPVVAAALFDARTNASAFADLIMATGEGMTTSIGATAANRQLPQRTTATTNPFLAIHPAARYALAAYFLFYHLLFPMINAIHDPSAQPLLYPRFAAQALYVFLLAAPFLVVKAGGWLHPLFLLPIVKTLSLLVKNPLSIVAPFESIPSTGATSFSFSVPTISVAESLSLPLSTLAEHRLELTLLYCLGLAAYYAGYAYLGAFAAPEVAFHPPRRIPAVSVAMVALSLIGAVYVVATSGGLSAHLVLMRSGRQEMFQAIGPLLALMTFAPFMVLIWFAYERRPFNNPLFVAAAVTAGLVPLLTTGSRSSVIFPMTAMIVLWWHKRNRILIWPTLFALVIALGVMGGFGALRQDFRSTDVDWSMLSPDRIGEWFDDSATEMTARGAAESDLAAVAGALGKGFLNGRTYLNTVFFWVPRGVWADKPRSAGTYNMWINFAGAPLDEPPPEGEVWGIPVSAPIEAFWNFQLPGVVVVGLLLGAFHRGLTTAAIRYVTVPAVLPIVVYMAISVNGTGQSLTRGIRDAVLFYVVLRLMGALHGKRRRRRPKLMVGTPTPRSHPHDVKRHQPHAPQSQPRSSRSAQFPFVGSYDA